MKKTLAAALLSLLLSPPALAAGPADTFQAKCAACHGKDGKGQSDMAKKLGVKDLTASKLSAADIEKTIANGKGKMTPFKGKLSASESSGAWGRRVSLSTGVSSAMTSGPAASSSRSRRAAGSTRDSSEPTNEL